MGEEPYQNELYPVLKTEYENETHFVYSAVNPCASRFEKFLAKKAIKWDKYDNYDNCNYTLAGFLFALSLFGGSSVLVTGIYVLLDHLILGILLMGIGLLLIANFFVKFFISGNRNTWTIQTIKGVISEKLKILSVNRRWLLVVFEKYHNHPDELETLAGSLTHSSVVSAFSDKSIRRNHPELVQRYVDAMKSALTVDNNIQNILNAKEVQDAGFNASKSLEADEEALTDTYSVIREGIEGLLSEMENAVASDIGAELKSDIDRNPVNLDWIKR